MGKLTARQVETLKKPGRHADGGNLYLKISKAGTKSWTFFYRGSGTMKEMGLGSAATVSLAEARIKAMAQLKLLHEGKDPQDVRKATHDKQEADRLTFGEFADDYLESARVTSIKNKADRRQWERAVKEHAAPLRHKPLAHIGTDDIVKVLRPVWRATPETGRKLRLRLEEIINSAKAKGKFTGDNPARWRGHLKAMKDDFPLRRRETVEHHAALKYDDLAGFMAKLRSMTDNSIAAKALEFCILTVTRSGETLGAQWGEIDMAKAIWAIPAKRMKAGHEHRIPLPARAVTILTDMKRFRVSHNEFVFPGLKRGRSLSNMAMTSVLRRMGRNDITVHGFRSSFRDWASERTNFSHETCEHVLAHRISDKAEAAYRRGDQFEKRRKLMDAWQAFAESRPLAKVVQLKKR